ncbi:uncharacterized protein LOC131878793 [Tigriopus californicus]|uniref:uncharacterized protein LOC131878793 n=1 Tax=Tigriopus californicus TaxID=6832 RepID=UPI0027DA8A94|nr:uncharacterized protein LOC131878793 [Tigriopus californicus]|eukprot:TCALIF_03737-PA protein Name:"Similar to ESBP6 Uncharacterized transporter ESBP6 (Saccharomyces cerevisiae (strain ATCC 204508 / S288c))" AED:0.00 eAED:0.00 QI:19/1/1/1/1/1/3/338/533
MSRKRIIEGVKSAIELLKGVPWRGLLAILGGFTIQLVLGAYNSFANIMPYMVSYMRKYSADDKEDLNYSTFIIVQSAFGVTQGCVLPIGSVLVRAIGVKAAVICGSLLFVTGPFLSSWTVKQELWMVVVSYGILSSIGHNLAIIPTLTIPMAWFPQRRGLVAGVVVSGFGMGALVFNQFQTHFANPRNLPVCSNGTDAGYFVDDEILLQVPALLKYSSALYAALLGVGAYLLLSMTPPKEAYLRRPSVWSIQVGPTMSPSPLQYPTKPEKEPMPSLSQATIPSLSSSLSCSQSLQMRLRSIRKALGPIDQILCKREFYPLWVSRFGLVMISQGFFAFYKAFGLKELGYNDDFLSTVGALAAIFNCAGRVGFGFLLDRFSYKSLMLVESVIVLGLSSSFYWMASASQYGMAASLWLLNLFSTGVFSMHPAVCNKIFGPNLDSIAIGMVGSSDIVNNLLIGFLSRPLMVHLGWMGYFLCISSLSFLVFAVTLVFPKESKNRNTKQSSSSSSSEATTSSSDDLSALPNDLSLITRL